MSQATVSFSTMNNVDVKNSIFVLIVLPRFFLQKQGRKRPLDTPQRKIERREREGKREKER